MTVQTFKVGPDFLDPTYLARASGRTCYNLDAWMTSATYVRELFARAAADADLAIIEGVMGLFDGASPCTLEGSTAEIALLLDAPVVLVVGAHGAARSLAAMVKGFATFEPGVGIAGVIANQAGSPRHKAWLADALAGASLPPLVGAVPRGDLPALPGRHLGLLPADQGGVEEQVFESLADACSQHVDLTLLLELAASSLPSPSGRGAGGEGAEATAAPASECMPNDMWHGRPRPCEPRYHTAEGGCATRVRLGIARDEAFHFYYPDNLDILRGRGAELVPFSPLADAALPENLDGLYFGGGYPELRAAALAANTPMLESVRRFAASGRLVYAECGGLMYLGRALHTLDGARHLLAGVLPVETAMLAKLKTLGYADVTLAGDSLWGAAGDACRGHEFHYSEIVADQAAAEGWRPAYFLRHRQAAAAVSEGYQRGRVLASYVHLHWGSRVAAVDHLLACCEGKI
jgi:cobyrinic acid a,c-diamide synthase